MFDKLKNLPLLGKVLIAIALGIGCSYFFPDFLNRSFVTLNGIFGNFLGFTIPLIIVGLVAPGIAELGKGAGKLLAVTAAIAYGSTLFAGFFSYFTCDFTYPVFLDPTNSFSAGIAHGEKILPYFSVEMPPLFSVTTALVFAFVLGLGLCAIEGNRLKNGLIEFRDIINKVISGVIIPLLPIYIFGIFLQIGAEGQAGAIMKLFIKVIAIIFVMHVSLLFIQFVVAGSIVKKNPIKLLITMLPAYVTALGTQSSAATIPVTLRQAIKNGVDEKLAGFVIPLCATIHLAGSTLKIVACAFAILWMQGMPHGLDMFAGFICMLGITMVAAPGVPGGAIMAALGLLASMLGFNEDLQGLMIALYIAMDTFGTACNVTGDGAIALVMDKIYRK
ncbi:MAG: dicarboxylate/amino acid:cation symporter [Bacteroidales bacterium]|nr:dicarboxylate/amino acid:cation symporter [Bacteroidales bacterium]